MHIYIHLHLFLYLAEFYPFFFFFNQAPRLCTLDASSAGDGYVNPMLLVLHLLPWAQAHCLASLSRSQFALSDEIGFLFHSMRQSMLSTINPYPTNTGGRARFFERE